MSVLGNLLFDQPAKTTTVDNRTPQGTEADVNKIALQKGLQNQYEAATKDPYAGMPGPIDQQYQTNKIVADSFNKAAGAGHTGMDVVGSVVAPAVTNYYDSLATQRNQYLQNLQNSLVNVTNSAYPQYNSMGTPAKPSLLTNYVNGIVGGASNPSGAASGATGAAGGATGGAGSGSAAGNAAAAAMIL